MVFKNLSKLIAAAVLLVGLASCEKDLKDFTAPSVAHIVANAATGSMSVTDQSPTYKLGIGITTVSGQDRKVKFTYEGSAIRGTEYNAPDELTIPAGSSLDSLGIATIYDAFPSGIARTVKVKIANADGYVSKNGLLDSFTLTLQKVCDVDISSFEGDYANTRETFGTSNYTYLSPTGVSNITPITTTSARVSVSNIFDYFWNDIDFVLDWTNPSAYSVTVVPASSGIADAGTIDADYAGEEVQVRAFAGSPGTFSSCNGTITLRMQLGVAGIGWFPDLYTVYLIR